MYFDILKRLGFSDKAATVYVALLRLGPSSVRALAENAEMNRGSAYEMIKWLRDKGLVSFYEKDAKQYFVAEDPKKLEELVEREAEDLAEVGRKLKDIVPELKSIYDNGGERPVARYYEKSEMNKILEDVLTTCEQRGETDYRIYSAAGIREYLYDSFETFSDVRVAKNIAVKAIALGIGGEIRGLDERKWLDAPRATQTYIIIYPGKTAYISLDAKKEPFGVVIENEGVYETQKTIFDKLWNTF